MLGVIGFRPLAYGEAGPVEAVFDGMSPRSRALRFLAPTPRLTKAMRRMLSDADQSRHVAWVAGVGGRPIGLGSYVRHPDDPTTADLALAVVDRHQGAGIGRRLLAILAEQAARAGVRAFTFSADPYNGPVLALMRRAGAVARYEDGLVQGVLPVAGAARLNPAA